MNEIFNIFNINTNKNHSYLIYVIASVISLTTFFYFKKLSAAEAVELFKFLPLDQRIYF